MLAFAYEQAMFERSGNASFDKLCKIVRMIGEKREVEYYVCKITESPCEVGV